MADAMLTYRRDQASNADFALVNAGGIRATIDEGPITRGEVLTSFPFGNAIVEVTVIGQLLWDVLEGVVSGVSQLNGKAVTSLFQISRNIRVEYNPDNANGTKLVKVEVNGTAVDRARDYHVVTLDFIAGGGDNIFEPFEDFVTLDLQADVLNQYIVAQSPVDIKLDGRIAEVNGIAPAASGTASVIEGGSATQTRNSETATGSSPSAGVRVSGSSVTAAILVATFAAVLLGL